MNIQEQKGDNMKIETEVKEYRPNEYGWSEYVFRVCFTGQIPIGAKVTVEWEDDNVHQCEGMVQEPPGYEGSHIIQREHDQWWPYMDSDRVWGRNITYCPCCGERLT